MVAIGSIFVVAKNVILVTFTSTVAVNEALKNIANYTITNLSGGPTPVVTEILPTYKPDVTYAVFFKIEQLVCQQEYSFNILDKVIQDQNGNNIDETTKIWLMHSTKVDSALGNLAKLYNTSIGSGIRAILDAMMISDEQIGGDF